MLREIRKKSELPILILTAFSDEEYKIDAFTNLADGYIEKPFSLPLLKVRVDSLIKKYSGSAEKFEYGDTEVNFTSYTAKLRGKEVDMNAKELEILKYLLENQGQALTRAQIIDNVWKETDEIPFDRVIDLYIKELRKKLELDYIDNCIEIVDGLNQNISQILSISSLEHLKDDEETLRINDILVEVLDKYKVMASPKNIAIENRVSEEEIYIEKSALKIILSNLVSNAVKYTKEGGFINIGVVSGWFYIENNYEKDFDIDRIFNVEFNSSKENSNGLGLYIVRNLLLNYNLNYDVSKTQEKFIFKIELSL